MSELRRLSEGPLSTFDRAALRSASLDRPSPGARLAAQAALGLAVGSAVAGGAATGAAGTAAAAKAASGFAFAKIALLTVAVGVVSAGVSVAVFSRSHEEPAPSAPVSTARVESVPTAARPTETRPEPAIVSVNDLPTAAPPPARIAPVQIAAPVRSAAPVSRLGDETAALAAVRAKLAAGDTAGAHAALDAYKREFESAVLAPEASALRVDTYVAAGDRTRAVSAAREYLAASPSGPAAARMRALIDRIHDRADSTSP